MRRRKIASVLAATVAMSGALITGTAPAAHAAVFSVSIDVAANGAANGSVSSLSTLGESYTSVLTATGAGTCTLTNGPTVIADFDTGTGNPSTTDTQGGCTLYDASAVYTLTYTSVVGISSVWYRACAWTLGIMTCTPQGATV